MKRHIILLFLSIAAFTTASAQHFNIKSNLLYDATTTINLGVEVGLGRRTSLDISGNYNPWTFSDHKQWQHWMVQPELRLWTCERFNGHFFGIHALGGQYNMNNIDMPFGIWPKLKDSNFQGDFYGGGISYGYQWILSNRFSLEASIGAGYLYVKYDQYDCSVCGTKLDSGTKHYFGPTKLGLSLVYFIF